MDGRSEDDIPILNGEQDADQTAKSHVANGPGIQNVDADVVIEPTVVPEGLSGRSILYHRRFYILLLFALNGFTQGCVWNTWGPLTKSANIAFGWDDATIALLSNWGPIAYIVGAALFSWLMDVKGMRWATVLTIGLVTAGTGLRCITSQTPTATWLIHTGQFLNGLGGPVAMGGPPVLSAVWFPVHQRTTATGFSAAVNGLGVAVAFIIGPLVVPQLECNTTSVNWTTIKPHADDEYISEIGKLEDDYSFSNWTTVSPPERTNCSEIRAEITDGIMRLMYIECGFSSLLFILILLYFPAKPPTPPSITASVKRVEFKNGLKKLLVHKKFWMLGIPYALAGGVYGGWSSIFAIIVAPIGITEAQAGVLGFWATVAGQIAAILTAVFADVFSRRMKLFLLILNSSNVIVFLVFTLTCAHLIPYSTAVVYTTMVLGTMMLYATTPLFFELVCESTYPIAEGITNGFLTWLNNAAGLIFLFLVMIPMGHAWINWCLFGCFAICTPIFLLYKERYGRMDTDLQDPQNPGIQEPWEPNRESGGEPLDENSPLLAK